MKIEEKFQFGIHRTLCISSLCHALPPEFFLKIEPFCVINLQQSLRSPRCGSKNSVYIFRCVWKWLVPLNPMVLLIIIPIKWLFQTNPYSGFLWRFWRPIIFRENIFRITAGIPNSIPQQSRMTFVYMFVWGTLSLSSKIDGHRHSERSLFLTFGLNLVIETVDRSWSSRKVESPKVCKSNTNRPTSSNIQVLAPLRLVPVPSWRAACRGS